MTEPTVIHLNSENSIQFLVQYIELAQKGGVYELQESNVLKRSIDVLVNKVVDNEITNENAKIFLIRGILKGQKAGVYTLNDASLLHQVITFMNQTTQQTIPQTSSLQLQPQESNIQQVHQKVQEETEEFDLSELSENIPLVV